MLHLLAKNERSAALWIAEVARSRRMLAITTASSVLVAAERMIPAAAGLVLASRGATWALGVGLAGSTLLAARGLLRQAGNHAFRTSFFHHVAARIASRSSLGDTREHADRLEAVLFGSSYAASKLAIEQTPSLIGNVLSLLVLVPLALLIAPPTLVLVGLPVLLLAAAAVLLLRRAIARRMNSSMARSRDLVDAMAVLLRGHLDLVASGRAEAHAKLVAERGAAYSEAIERSERAGALAGRLPAAVALATAGLFGWLWLRDQPDVLVRGAAQVLVLGSAVPIVVGLGRGWLETQRFLRDVMPLLEMLDTPADPVSREGAAELDTTAPIRFHHVTFSYPSKQGAEAAEELALTNLSFTWKRHELLAIAGPNGAGKSTLVRLLLRLADPGEGAIYVGATDLREGNVAAWRRSIAYLPQRPYLPEALSVREAMAVLGPDVPEPELLEMLGLVELLPKLERLRPGDPLGARVGELSSGQRQRLALARVLSQRGAIMILDEPDANLDSSGLDILIRLLPRVATTRRVLVIAHEPRLLECATQTLSIVSHEVAQVSKIHQDPSRTLQAET